MLLTRFLVLLCFFFSGATGLLYEVVWIRLLGFTLGNTHHSITIVVAVFMGGLALGSFLGGRIADRSRDPLRLYGVLILAIGVLCLAVPFVIDAFQPLFGWIYSFHDGEPEAWPLMLVKVLVASAILVLPTTLMGATLPVLSRYFTRSLDSVGWDFGRLYAVNTFGAVTGAFVTGFWGIPLIGIMGCIILAVVIDFVIAAAVFVIARRHSAPPDLATGDSAPAAPPAAADAVDAAATSAPRLPFGQRLDFALPVFAFAASGFANMILQVGWTKALVGTIGNSTYAFSLIVTLFILGIGIGGAIMARLADRVRNIPVFLGVLMMVTSLFVLVTIPFLGTFPIWGALRFSDAVATSSPGGDFSLVNLLVSVFGPMLPYSDERSGFPNLLIAQVFMVSVVILPATTLMGMVFPIVGKFVTRSIETVGRSIGNAYFANTLGSILGTLTAGFILIPFLGRVYVTLYTACAISLIVGLALCLRAATTSGPRIAAAGVVIATLVFGFFTRPHGVLGSDANAWNPAIQSLGMYLYYDMANAGVRDERGFFDKWNGIARGLKTSNDVTYYREGVHATVAIVEDPHSDRFALRISGKPEGSADKSGKATTDMPHQISAAHLPMLCHPAPVDVLTLGLGSGVTLGGLTLYAVDPGTHLASPPPRLPDSDSESFYTVESIDSLEISDEVLEAVERFFAASNHDATRHPAVRHVLGDGRAHILYTDRRYDVVTSVPSNPWIAGIGNLFTEEFFEMVRDRLKPGGVFCQWIHSLKIRVGDFKVVLRTIERVFPEHVSLWDLGYDCILIASNEPQDIPLARVAAALRDPRIANELALLGISQPEHLGRYLKLDADGIRRFTGEGPTNRDLFPYLEFSAPYGLYGHRLDTFDVLRKLTPSETDRIWSGATAAQLARMAELRGGFREFQAVFSLLTGGSDQAGRTQSAKLANHLRAILEVGDPWLERHTGGIHLRATLGLSRLLIRGGRPARALPILLAHREKRLQSGVSESFDILNLLGVAYAQTGEFELAHACLGHALKMTTAPNARALILNDIGRTYESQRSLKGALSSYEQAVAADPTLAIARENLERVKRLLAR